MKKYFFYDGKEKHGPLSLDELKQEDISKETLIWFKGLDDWTLASELDDMKPILELIPPPIDSPKEEPIFKIKKSISEIKNPKEIDMLYNNGSISLRECGILRDKWNKLTEEEKKVYNNSIRITEKKQEYFQKPFQSDLREASQGRPTKKGMFSNPFSFDGRIRRTEYGISFIIVSIFNTFFNDLVASGKVPIIGLAYIPILWFFCAQGTKRCHDMGQSGWFQIIPFYVFWMIFASGEKGINKYGVNPKS